MSEGKRPRPARGAGRTRGTAARVLLGLAAALALLRTSPLTADAPLPSPEQFIGFKVGADNKLARWDTIVSYMKLLAERSNRVRLRELGKTNGGNPFIVLEISS